MIRIGPGSIIGLATAAVLLGILVIRALRFSLKPMNGSDRDKGDDDGSIMET